MTDDVQARIQGIVQGSDVVLFMKGSPLFPQCGFSSRAVAILNHLNVEFESVDVLQDQGVRQGIKTFSDNRELAKLSPHGLADVVFETGGVQPTLDLASTLCRTSGRLVIAGFHQDGLRHVDLCLWNWRGLDIVNAHERDAARCADAMRRAFARVETGALDLDALCTHQVPLDDLARAFTWIRDRPDGFLKATASVDAA